MDRENAKQLLNDMGITLEEFELRKKFLLLTDDDIQNIVGVGNEIREIPDAMFDSFYNHLMEFHPTKDLFEDKSLVERLKKSQTQYFKEMLSGEYGYEYLLKRISVGEVHSRLNIIPLWYVGAFSKYITNIIVLLDGLYDKDTAQILPKLISILKIVLLDIILTLESYHYLQYKAQDEMRRAKEEVEQASLVKSEMLNTLSHEIRSPMSGILGMAELLLSEDISQQSRHYLNLVKETSTYLISLATKVLELSKIKSGRYELEHREFSPRKVVEFTVAAFDVSSKAKGLRLTHSMAPDVPDVLLGDPERLRQVLINLVGNAVKFTEKGVVSVSVEMDAQRPDSPDAVRLLFTVTDDGKGIPANKLEHIFESFTQVSSSDSKKHGGTGLGLAISKSIVEMMHGAIWAESEAGTGSTFFFTAEFGLIPGA